MMVPASLLRKQFLAGVKRFAFQFQISVTHWERTAKPITRPLKVEELCKAFVLYRQSKGLDKATLSEDRYISKRLQKHLGGYMAHELGIAEIRSFLDTAKTSDSLEHKLYPSVSKKTELK